MTVGQIEISVESRVRTLLGDGLRRHRVDPGAAEEIAASTARFVVAVVSDAFEPIRDWIDVHRVGESGYDCVQARDVAQIIDRLEEPVATTD